MVSDPDILNSISSAQHAHTNSRQNEPSIWTGVTSEPDTLTAPFGVFVVYFHDSVTSRCSLPAGHDTYSLRNIGGNVLVIWRAVVA